MAHDPGVRSRAKKLFVEGHSWPAVSRRVGVPEGTLKRWGREGRWLKARRRLDELEGRVTDLLADMVDAARESRDPQQVFAAQHAARMVGLDRPAAPPADVRTVAKALVRVLDAHPLIGPILRRDGERRAVVELVASEAERLEREAA